MHIKHLISVKQFKDRKELEKIFSLADKMEKCCIKNIQRESLRGKILGTIFYEPSTRTRFSFESAMCRLGGNVITADNALSSSSAAKGETLADTIKVISGYVDVIVLRHPQEGSSKIASESSLVPVINAGDGAGEHPSQAILDLYTIKKEIGRIDNFEIAFVGDLLYGRTVHSLIQLISLCENVKIYLISPTQLMLPQKYKDYLKEKKIEFEESVTLEKKILEKIDVLYVTRIQKERFKSEQEYAKLKDSYIIDKRILSQLKKIARIMHALPRVNEIFSEVDNDKRAAYFRQAKNGLYLRMALLEVILT